MLSFDGPEWQDQAERCAARLRERAVEVDRAGKYPFGSMRIVHEHGLLNAVAPRALGGLDLGPKGDLPGMFRLLEILASGCGSTAQLVAVHLAAMSTIKAVGTPAQLERFAAATRDEGATFCYLGSSPTQRFTVTGGRQRYDGEARRVDGGWMVTADKFFATGSMGCRYVMALCSVADATDMSGILAPVIPADAAGVEIQDTWDNMGQRATSSGICNIRDVFVPDEMTIGGPGDFLKPGTLGPLFQLTFSALFTGMAQGALDFTMDYMLNHATAPVGLERAVDEPHVPTLIGSMSVQLEASRALVRRGAEMIAALERRQVPLPEAARAVFQAKCHASQVSVDLGTMLFRLCGARATSRRHNADMHWRNARTLTLHDNLDRQLLAIGKGILGIAETGSFTR